MHIILQKSFNDKLFYEFEQVNDPIRLFTHGCHTQLTFNLKSFIKYKEVKEDEIIKNFDINENIFNNESEIMIATLFKHLENQSHLYKLQNSK
jgi:hypothetical protein